MRLSGRRPVSTEDVFMPHAVSLITDDRNRVRAQCRCTWRSPWVLPDAQSQPRRQVAERVATHHLQHPAR